MQQSSQQQIKEHIHSYYRNILQVANDKMLSEKCAIEQRTDTETTAQLPAPSHSTQCKPLVIFKNVVTLSESLFLKIKSSFKKV